MRDYTKEQLCILWLKSSDLLGWNAVDALIEKHGSAESVWRSFSADMMDELGKAYDHLKKQRDKGLDALLIRMEELNARAIFREDDDYPENLITIANAPRILYVRGTLPEGPSVSIVGSRRDTRYGKASAFRIAKELAENGVTVISGMARGIDTAAHEGAIAGKGKTVAVLGCGIDVCYPPENKILMENILISGGAVVTELPPGTQPLSFHFPLRNRIISGLSDALLLIEARLKSGTNSTVNYALEQGKEVFALPGNVDAPGSELPLKLLKEGALICTEGNDILEYMKWSRIGDKEIRQMNVFEDTEDPVLRALLREEKTFEELIEETGFNASELGIKLTMLEFEGSIERRAGRAYAIKRN